MSGAKRRAHSLPAVREAMERIATRYAPPAHDGVKWLSAPQVVDKVAYAANCAAQQLPFDQPVPTRTDALDALMHVDDARESLDRDELRLIMWAKHVQGASWEEIGAALGYGRSDGTGSKQGAQGRYGALKRRMPGSAKRFEEEARAYVARAAEQQGDEQQ